MPSLEVLGCRAKSSSTAPPSLLPEDINRQRYFCVEKHAPGPVLRLRSRFRDERRSLWKTARQRRELFALRLCWREEGEVKESRRKGREQEHSAEETNDLRQTNATLWCPEAGPNVPIIREKRAETGSTAERTHNFPPRCQ